MEFDDVDWESNSLTIASDGKSFFCAPFDDIKSHISVPKFSDIIFREPIFMLAFKKYITKEIINEIKPQNLEEVFSLSYNPKFDEVLNNSQLFNLVVQKGLFINPEDYTEKELNRLRPLATILKNLHLNFFNDYKNSEKVGFPGVIYFPVGDKIYQFNENEDAFSFLTIKKEGQYVLADLHLGENINMSSCCKSCFDSLEQISNNVKMMSMGNLGKYSDVFEKGTAEDIKDFKRVCEFCKVGLSGEATQFREQIYGPDGKDF